MAKTIAEIRQKVRADVSRASGVPMAQLQDGHTLKENLRIPHTGFVTLAQSLDSFVRAENPRGAVRVADLENNESTVGSTDTLVQERMEQ